MPDARAVIAAAKQPKPPLAKDARLALQAWTEEHARIRTTMAEAHKILQALPDNAWINAQKRNLEEQLPRDTENATIRHISGFLTHLQEHGVTAAYPHDQMRHLVRILRLDPDKLPAALTDWLTARLAGQSINETATALIRRKLQKAITTVTHYKHYVTLEKFVTVRQVMTQDGKMRNSLAYQPGRSDENLRLLARALTRFQTNETTTPDDLRSTLHAAMHYNDGPQKILEVPIQTGFPRSPQIIVGRTEEVRILFATPADARAFLTLYDLQPE